MGTYEVDGGLDVLDEGGGALVLGGRVAVEAAHVLRLPSGVGHDVLRPRRAAADETHHLGASSWSAAAPIDGRLLRVAGVSPSSSSLARLLLPVGSPGRMRTREEKESEREWVSGVLLV